ncbi:MAG: flippase-like domain-containing protein [Actinobacteria bacterium]|uniref:Unannotated protein n=1 Tax=freshwater metagenome TaxID=449393 RepID=A0A6J7J2W9_9ZZZZ|nr:flippase-like domain-containing protein [Actinomycetota bacterium]
MSTEESGSGFGAAARSSVGAPGNTAPGEILPDAFISADEFPRRVRRPLDLARFTASLVLTASIVLVAWFATSTTAGIGTDLSTGAQLLPSLIVLALNIIGGIGTLGLPIAASIALVVRRRLRQLFDALVALLVAIVVLTIATNVISGLDSPRLLAALAGSANEGSTATAPILGGLIAFITVARLMGRRPWNVLSILVIGSLVTVAVLNSGIALAGVGVSLSIGWAIGLICRYVLGTPTTRPSSAEIVAALTRGGFTITSLSAEVTTSRGRRYRAVTSTGQQMRIAVLDRDLEGAGLVSSIWTAVRLRSETGSGAFNMRRSLDHTALMSYAGEAAGAPMPRLLLASEVGPDSSLLAFEHIDGMVFSDATDLTDTDLDDAWRAVKILHDHQISHRRLSADHLIRATDGGVQIIGYDGGTVAAGDVSMRIDLAEMLCTLALIVGVDRAVASGQRVLGDAGLLRALPTLQPVALSWTTRRAMRKNKQLMVSLRDVLLESRPGEPVEQIRLERVKIRTLVMIVVGSIAGYVLLSQLAQVDLATLITSANGWWVLAALVLSLITYVGAAWSLSGFVPERLALHRTILAQLAGDFATLVSPPTLGAVAINMRFLQRAGLHPALAAASVGVSQVMAFVFHILLLFAFGIAAGTQHDFTFNPPRLVVIAIAAVAVLVLALLAVPAIRRLITDRVRPTLREVVPRLVTLAQRPYKLLEGVGGILVLNLAYIGVLIACVHAFGGELSIAVIAVVYLAGATIGQAAPTPGGLGAVEAALSAGLTAAGLDGGVAVSAVLLYRLVTFWLPTLPGYWSFNWLTKKGAL